MNLLSSNDNNVHFPRDKFDDALKRRDPREASRISGQVHQGEGRRITGTLFYDDHICFVAGGLAHLLPDAFDHKDLAISAALLHDAVENAEKLVTRIREALEKLPKKKPIANPGEWLKKHVPPLFFDFLESRYQFDSKDAGDAEKILALRHYVGSASQVTFQRTKRNFRLYVTELLHKEFGTDTDQLVYILTRHKPEQLMNVYAICAKGVMDSLRANYKLYRADGKDRDTAQFLDHHLKPNDELARFLTEMHGFDRNAPRAKIDEFLAEAISPAMAPEYERGLAKYMALNALHHPNVLGAKKNAPLPTGKAAREALLANLLNEANTDKFYATGFTDNRNAPLNYLLPIAANIKCLDIIHNLCTLDFKNETQCQHAIKVVFRTSHILPFLEKAIKLEKERIEAEKIYVMAKGPLSKYHTNKFETLDAYVQMSDELIVLANEALKRANRNLMEACKRTITMRQPAVEPQLRKAALRPNGKYAWLITAMNKAPGTRLEAA